MNILLVKLKTRIGSVSIYFDISHAASDLRKKDIGAVYRYITFVVSIN